jgi:hypothetical protein
MPWTTECGNSAVIAYLDTQTNEILYRCHQHRLQLEGNSFGERMKVMTIDEAVAHEVMND